MRLHNVRSSLDKHLGVPSVAACTTWKVLISENKGGHTSGVTDSHREIG